LKDCLRLFLIIPEFGLCYFLFELENLRAFVFRIKDTLELAVSFLRLRPLSLEVLRAFIPPVTIVYESRSYEISQKSTIPPK